MNFEIEHAKRHMGCITCFQKTLDENGKVQCGALAPLCEVYGQLSSQPVAQIKTKAFLKIKRLFENVERHVSKKTFVNKLVYISNPVTMAAEVRLGPNDLVFESNFESGNLLKV